jgi:hypothetical protein
LILIWYRELELVAKDIIMKCYDDSKLITQDLLICEVEIFFKHTVLELAVKAETYELVCLSPFQALLTDIWYDRINPHSSHFQVKYLVSKF